MGRVCIWSPRIYPQLQLFTISSGQLDASLEEHIANQEQIVYIACSPDRSLSVFRFPVIGVGAMASAALRLVEGSSMDKAKALDAALSQIERNFGKGSIMRLGKNDKS